MPPPTHRRGLSAVAAGAPELSETEFQAIADATLGAIECAAGALDDTIRDGFDLSVAAGVLTLKLGDGKGTYVINKQTPNRQLWWSSPLSGPKRYTWDARRRVWANTRDGHTMVALLKAEIVQLTGVALALAEEGGGQA